MTAPDAHNRSTPGNAPVTAPEADALNAWLESITGPRHAERPLRHVERSRDISGRSRSRRASNGHVDPATSLQATAEAFHARLTRAEHEAEPDVPADAIWEKIMASNTIAAPTQNVAGRAADLVSARASRPTRTIPAWLSGSHWAVSAFMLAAVVVGIVALYGSFAGSPGSNDDPAINPNFAMGTPGTATPTDAAAWLQPIYPNECNVEPLSDAEVSAITQGSGDETERSYAPTGPVDDTLAGEIAGADRAWQSCFVSGTAAERAALQSSRFTREGPGEAFGSETSAESMLANLDLFDASRALGEAMLSGDWRDYYIESDLFDDGTPSVIQIADFIPTIPIPGQAFQLGDGRVAIPIAQLVGPGNEADQFIDGEDIPNWWIPVHILAQDPAQNGRWVIDETFIVCMGDCDRAHAEIVEYMEGLGIDPNASLGGTPTAATPAADAIWLQPYSPDECDVEPRTLDEAAAFMRDPGESVPRQYGPVSPVSEELAREVASANRMFQSCDLTGETGEWRAMVSPRLIFEGQGSPYFDTITSRSATYEEFVANHRELSEMLLTDPTRDYTVESTEAIPLREGGLPDYSASDSEIFWSVMLPNDIVLLPDGRIGGPEVTLLPANHEEFQQAIEDIRLATPAPYSYEMVIYRIYAQDPTQDGQWVLDETLALCARGCDAFYAEAEEYYQSNLPVLAATPVISPDVATPSATPDDAAWLAPISPDECDVDARSLEEVAAFIEDPGETVPRDYGIVGPADPVTAAEVSRADRVWHSCNLFEGAAERRAMESPRYIHQESPNALANVSPEEQQATYRAMRHLSEEVISEDYQTYRIDSSATFQQELQAIRNDQAFVPPDMQGTVIVPSTVPSGICQTPRPSCGMVTPLFKVTVAAFAKLKCLSGTCLGGIRHQCWRPMSPMVRGSRPRERKPLRSCPRSNGMVTGTDLT